jgi:beta-lactamase class A
MLPRALRRRRCPIASLPACLLLLLPLLAAEPARAAGWSEALHAAVERIDGETPGRLGVYVRELGSGETMSHGGNDFWYLGSTAKVLVAIAVLQQADAGTLQLGESVALTERDRIEAGQLVWQAVGTRYSVDALLKRMLGDSDNTAANMLIRRVGVERLNESARAALGSVGFQELTDFAAIRRDVYAEIHPDARRLGNDALVRIAAAPMGPARVEAVRRALGKQPAELDADSIGEAYDRYYRTQRNAATLEAYAGMLERLVRGELLSPASTERLFQHMKIGIYTNYRLQAGLPRSVTFIHKTGTQYLRACHAGVISPEAGGAKAIVVAACTAELDEQREAGTVLKRVGEAISATVLAAPR